MKIRLIVPNCNRGTPPVVAYGPSIARIAGGFTATQATGGWIGQGSLVVEPVTAFDCHIGDESTTRIVDARLDFVLLARRICAELRQDRVYLEIDDQVTYVKE